MYKVAVLFVCIIPRVQKVLNGTVCGVLGYACIGATFTPTSNILGLNLCLAL